MTIYWQTLVKASTLSSVYPQSNLWVVCSEVNVMTNDSVRTGGTIRPRYTAVELMKLSREMLGVGSSLLGFLSLFR